MITKEKFKFWLKNHYLVIIFFILTGLLSLSQQLLMITALGKAYNGVPAFNGANVDVYLTRVREITDGHGWVSSAYYFEYKNNQPTMLPIGEHVYAAVGRLIGLSPTNTLLLNQFLFPALLFLLVYFLTLKLTQGQTSLVGRLNAVATGLLVVFGYNFTDLKSSWIVLSGGLESMHSLLWNRPVNPVIGVVLMFLLLLVIWQMIEQRRRYLFLPAGIILALTIGYYFTFSLSIAIMGVLTTVCFFKKEHAAAFNLLLVGLFGFVISSPYWYLVAKMLGGSGGGNVINLYGGAFTRQPVFNKVLLAGGGIFLLCFLIEYFRQKKIQRKIAFWWWFCLSFFVGGLMALNAQIITGINLAHPHFVQFTIPLTLVTLMVLGFNFFRPRFFKIWRAGLVVIFAVTILFGVQTARSYTFELGYSGGMQKLNEMFEWLNINTPKDCVIFMVEDGSTITNLIPALTHCNVYYTPVSVSSEATAERNYHNFLSYLRINEVPPSEVEDFLRNRYILISTNFFKNWDQLFTSGYQPWMDEFVKRVAADYPEFVKKDFPTELKRYKIDYILSPNELSKSLLQLLPSVNLLQQAGGLYLYQF